MATKVKHVVADSGAFIRNAPLLNIAENIYTVPEVIAESCDRATRRRIKMLPLDIKFKEPSGDALLFVSMFAKQTGDYRSLSVVDLKVMALTYDLEKQYKGTAHIRKELPKKPEYSLGIRKDRSGVTIASRQYNEGEALPLNQIGEKNEMDSDDEEYFDALQTLAEGEVTADDGKQTEELDDDDVESSLDDAEPQENGDTANEVIEERVDGTKEKEDKEDSEVNEGADDSEDDDNEGWITPANITDVKMSMGIETVPSSNEICVGCLTTDFAMQNVLIQMGLHVLSVDGMIIKKAKSYVLRCFGCMRITKDTSRVFCPHCGNKTLKRLSTTIEEDGTVRYWLAKNFKIHTRGTKYSLPKPQGGKHALNPILCADQPTPDQRASKKSLQKVDILSDDIIADMSPFSVNDVTSRAAQLGITGRHPPQWSKRNPNENRKRSKNRKGK